MNFRGKKKLINIVEKIHISVFGCTMSDEMRVFLDNLSWSFFGGVVSGLLLFVATVIAGRYLGPEEFGKYSLMVATSQFFVIPMLLGMGVASVRFISKTKELAKKKKYIVSSSISVVLAISAICCIFVLFQEEFFVFKYINKEIIVIVLIFSVVFVFKTLFDAHIRGLHLFEYQSLVKSAESFVVLTCLSIAIFFLNSDSYIIFGSAVIIGGVVMILLYILKLYKYFSTKPDVVTVKKLFGYGKFAILGAILAAVFTIGDKFLINMYLGTEELGIYMAYYAVSVTFVAQIAIIIINVFFPKIAGIDNKLEITNKIDKLMKIGFIPIFLAMSVFIFVMIKLFGNEYPVSIIFIILFAILGTLHFFVPFFASIVNAHSRQTYFWGFIFFAGRSAIFIFYVILLITFDYFTMYTLLIGLIMNYIVDIYNLRFIIKKYATKKV